MFVDDNGETRRLGAPIKVGRLLDAAEGDDAGFLVRLGLESNVQSSASIETLAKASFLLAVMVAGTIALI
jgi:hypothetical protein